MTIKQLNGGGKNDTRVRVVTAALPAGTGIATNWFALETNVNTVVASLGGWAIEAYVDGRIIVMPGRFFGVHVLASAVGLTPMCQIYWTEEMLLNG
jgi:hypothetical protein